MQNDNNEIKLASAYLRQNKIYIHSYSKTTVGLRISYGKIFTPEINDLIQIGGNIIEAFKEIKASIPHPTQEEFREQDKNSALLTTAGVKTSNIMMKSSIRTDIYLERNKIQFIPLKFGGTSGSNKGYHELEDKIITTTDLSPENLGKLLLEAFNRCE